MASGTLPEKVCDAAGRGNQPAVDAWLDSGDDINVGEE